MIIILILLLLVVVKPGITGNVVAGDTQAVGKKLKPNSHYGVIKGYVRIVITDNGNVIDEEEPNSTMNIYFVPTEQIVDWNESITCATPIPGNLNKVDADNNATDDSCMEKKYSSPTAYGCTAKNQTRDTITIYISTTDNATGNNGCFASKIPSATYDVFV